LGLRRRATSGIGIHSLSWTSQELRESFSSPAEFGLIEPAHRHTIG
jgi:hypothetical protein